MCGRFFLKRHLEALAAVFDAAVEDEAAAIEAPRYNIRPTDPVASVVAGDGGRHVRAMRWGFIPRWYKAPGDGPLLINARGETIAVKPAFREACRTRRCLIPASGFYEWRAAAGRGKEPYAILPENDGIIAFAGIWQDWTSPEGEGLTTCAIVTTAATGALAEIHHRTPVIVGQDNWPLWLGEAGHGAATLMRAPPGGAMIPRAVGRDVNSAKAEGASLLDALHDERRSGLP